jgi:archaellum component FlaC
MELEEIKEKLESFERTEKALDDEYYAHAKKSNEFTYQYKKFIKKIRDEGYEHTSRGWEKQ